MPTAHPTFDYKTYLRPVLKETTMQGNRLRGVASVMGNLDLGADVIFPGAFRKCLPDFLQKGFIAQGHEWDELPIAFPVSAQENGNELVTEAEFHTTPEAQNALTVCKERLAAGKQVGLSVGFMSDPGGCHYFENGENLLTFASDNKYDLTLFDTAALKGYDGYCRAITKVVELFEYSVVTVPMNPLAVATEAKSLDVIQDERTMEAFLRDAGLSKNCSKKFISISKAIFLRRDAGSEDDAATSPNADDEVVPTAETVIETAPIIPSDQQGARLRFNARGDLIQWPI